jgi:phage I-like protein
MKQHPSVLVHAFEAMAARRGLTAERFKTFTEEERKRLAASGVAMPDGSFPIVTVEDLKNAIHAIGRAANPEAAKAHIRKRALALGEDKLLPEGWSVSDENGTDAFGAAIELETFEAQPNEAGLVPGKPIQLFKLGAIKARDGRKLNLGDTEVQSLLEDAKALASDGNEIALLAEHGEDPTEGMRAMGWVDPSSIELRSNGIWASRPAWTADGYSDIKSRKRRYISPHVFSVRDADGTIRPRRWLEITVTNIPAITGMASVAASATAKPNPSPDAARERKERHMTKLATLLGLADGASEEDIEKAVTQLKAKAPEPKPEPKGADLSALVDERLGAALDKFAAAAEKKATEIVTASFAAKEKAARVETLLEQGKREGKLTTATAESFRALAAADTDAFEKTVLPNLKVVAPVSRIPAGNPVDLRTSDDEGAAFMTRAAQLADTMGITTKEALDVLREAELDAAAGKEN